MMEERIELEAFLEVLQILELNYDRVLPDLITSIWYSEFKYYDQVVLEKAFIECIKEYQYFPTIKQVHDKMIDKYHGATRI